MKLRSLFSLLTVKMLTKSQLSVYVLHWAPCKTNIMRRWNHNVILFRGISRFLSAVCRRWFPGQSRVRTCLVLCFARPLQLLPLACTSDVSVLRIRPFYCESFQTVEILARVISSANQCATMRSSRSFS